MNNNRNILYITILAILVFAAIAFASGLFYNFTNESFVFPDALSYQTASKYLFVDGFKAHENRPFGYPFVLGIPYLTGAQTAILLKYSLVVNFLFWIGSVWVIYRIGKEFRSAKLQLLFCIIFICTVTGIYMVFQTMAETMFIFFMLLFLRNLSEFAARRETKKLLAALFYICLSTVIRPVNYYLALSIVIFCLLYFARRKDVKQFFLAVLLFTVTIGLQLQLMHSRFHQYRLSYIQNLTAFYYLSARAEWMNGTKTEGLNHFMDNKMKAINEPADHGDEWFSYADSVYIDGVKNNGQHNTRSMLLAYSKNIRENGTSGNQAFMVVANREDSPGQKKTGLILYWLSKYENTLFSALLIVAACVSLFQLVRSGFKVRPADIPYLLALTIAAYYFLCSGISFWQGDRFNYVSYPLITFALLSMANRTRHTPKTH